jgi:hypothetical protein
MKVNAGTLVRSDTSRWDAEGKVRTYELGEGLEGSIAMPSIFVFCLISE